MSIKYKIPLVMLAALLLNVLVLFGYYQFIIANRVTVYQDNMNEAVTDAADNISGTLAGMNLSEVKTLIDSAENPRGFIFTLYNMDNEKVYASGKGGEAIGFSATAAVRLADGDFLLRVEKQIDLLNLRSQNVFRDLLLFEIILLFALFIVVGIYIHFGYVRELLRLKNKMSRYKNGDAPAEKNYRYDEIGQLESGFDDLSRSLFKEKQVQNRMIASISHDIKTPLTSVLGYSERAAKMERNPDKQRQYLQTVYNQAKDIEAIVDEFDDYLIASAPENNQMQQVKVSYICKMLEEEYSVLLSDQDIAFSVINKCNSEAVGNIDLLKLRRVFANIISNNIRHSGVEKPSIEVSAEQNNSHIIFKVSDNGKGVPEGDLPYIFEPFHTSDKSRRVSGLGLSICKQIVEGHSGIISAYNNNNGGLTVEFILRIC